MKPTTGVATAFFTTLLVLGISNPTSGYGKVSLMIGFVGLILSLIAYYRQ
jgi:hypothetical protein